MKRFLMLMCAGLLLLTGSGCAGTPQESTKKTPERAPYKILLTSAYDPLKEGFEPKKNHTIRFLIIRPDNTIVTNYNIVHEKLMHVIITKIDLNTFEHIHPAFDSNRGEFSFDISFDEPGAYRMFADFHPAGDEKNLVVTHDLIVGGVGAGTYTALQKNVDPIEDVGDYIIRHDIPGTIKSGDAFTYRLDITDKNGSRITPESYLGALGHSIMLRDGSLDYIHTHASPQDLLFTATADNPGRYAIFTQVQIKGKVYTTKRVIDVRKNTGPKKPAPARMTH